MKLILVRKTCVFKDVERQREKSGKRKGIEDNGGFNLSIIFDSIIVKFNSIKK